MVDRVSVRLGARQDSKISNIHTPKCVVYSQAYHVFFQQEVTWNKPHHLASFNFEME